MADFRLPIAAQCPASPPLLLLWLLPVLTATARENPSAAFIQRSMRQLSESTPQSLGKLRVLFYGQSITAQSWTKTVEKELRQRYPSVQFDFHNPAFGGFTAPNLVRTAKHDLFPWYPDPLIFHVYGPIEQYEEIVLTTDHIHVRHDNPEEIEESPSAQIIAVAKNTTACSSTCGRNGRRISNPKTSRRRTCSRTKSISTTPAEI